MDREIERERTCQPATNNEVKALYLPGKKTEMSQNTGSQGKKIRCDCDSFLNFFENLI